MATIKDIARLANVSQGTVSNVLNGRGNVSSERIRLVQNAAHKLGYVANAQAKQLRKEAPLTNNIAVILPNIGDETFVSIFNGIKSCLEDQGYAVSLFVTNSSPFKEANIVNSVAALRVAGVITVSCAIPCGDVYAPVLQNGGKVLFLLRDAGADNFIGFDFKRIGKEIGDYILQGQWTDVGLLLGPDYYSDNRDLHAGVLEAWGDAAASMQLQIVRSNWMTSFSSIFEFFDGGHVPQVLLLNSGSLLELLRLASAVSSASDCPPVVLLSQSTAAEDMPGIARYRLDYLRLGLEAGEAFGALQRGECPSIRKIIPPEGFRPALPPACPHVRRPVSIRVFLSKGQSANALMRIAPSFTRHTGIQVEFMQHSQSEMYDKTLQTPCDILRCSLSYLDLLPQDYFLPLDPSFFEEVTQGMLPRVREDFCRIGQNLCGIPFDMGAEMLAYRRDIFEDPLIKRMYYEQTGCTLTMPGSYDEYAAIVAFFDRQNNPASPLPAGTGIALDSKTELMSNFILRYLNYADDAVPERDHFIDAKAIFQAMRNISLCGQHALHITGRDWIGVTLDSFIHGGTAMEIVFLNYASDIIQLQQNIYGGQIGYAPVPGGRTYITGGSLLIPKTSAQPEAAKEFLRWACGKEQAELFTLLGGISPHVHVYNRSGVLQQYPWYKHLPAVIEKAAGRKLWSSLDAIRLETNAYPTLRAAASGELSPVAATREILSEMRACLL